MTPDPLAAEVERRVREELAELYDRTLDKALELRRKGELHLAAAYRSAASDVFRAERGDGNARLVLSRPTPRRRSS